MGEGEKKMVVKEKRMEMARKDAGDEKGSRLSMEESKVPRWGDVTGGWRTQHANIICCGAKAPICTNLSGGRD